MKLRNPQAQMTELLAETSLRGNKELEAALYAHADSVTRAIFGDDVYCERSYPAWGCMWRILASLLRSTRMRTRARAPCIRG